MPERTLRKPTRHADAASRLRALGPRLRNDNPIVPIVLEMLDAARRNVRMEGNSALARLYNTEVIGTIPQARLDQLGRNLSTLPDDLRTRLSAQPMRMDARLDDRDLQQARVQLDSRIARGVAQALMRPRLPIGRRGGVFTPMKGDVAGGGFEFGTVSKEVLSDIDPSVWKTIFDKGIFDGIVFALPDAPVLDSIMPKKAKGYLPKESVVLRVRYPDWANASFKVILSTGDDQKIDGQSLAQDYATLNPKVLGTAKPHGTRLQVALPADFRIGSRIRVQVTAGTQAKDTNRMPIARFTVPAVSPVFGSPLITAIKPADGQLPGHQVVIEGHNIGNVRVVSPGSTATGEPAVTTPSVKMACHVRLLSPNGADSDVHLPLTVIKPSPVGGVGSARFTLPVDLVPGDYWLQLVIGDAPGTMPSGIFLVPPVFEAGAETLVHDYTVKACKYEVTFNTMHCVDESNPETTLFIDTIDDEVFSECAIVADEQAWVKVSKVFTSFDDGETEAFSAADRAIYPITGGFGEVRVGLGLQVEVYESDDEDVQGWQKTMDAVGTLAAKVGKLLLDLGVAKGAAIAGAVAAIAEAISTIAGLFGGTESLGSRGIVWTAKELQEKTNNASRSFGGTLQFHNSDSMGSYDLAYTVRRMQ